MPDVASGWGRLTYGQANWGDAVTIKQGWGRLGWGAQAYGDSPTVTLSGLSATTSVGTPEVEVRPGWGTLNWGENGWGSVDEAIETLTGIGATSSVGSVITEIAVDLTGLSATASCPTQIDIPQLISGVSATVSEGQLNINNGADHTQGLATLVATSATGTISPADVMGVTGVEANTDVGSLTINSEDIIDITGVSATASVGSISPTEMTIGLTGVSATSTVGAIAPTEMTVGLTGQEATVSVGSFSIIAIGDIDITGNTSYNGVDVTGNTSYTDVEHVA